MRHLPLLPAILLAATPVVGVTAAERHFAYAQESGVVAPGNAELELQSTYKRGRTDYWVRQEHRVEVEFGLTEQLMGAVYLNVEQTTKAKDPATSNDLASDSAHSGSFELKYKFSDPVADGFGSALYAEATVGGMATEYEFKGILDKQIGPALLAANGIYEIELEREDLAETKREVKFGGILSATYAIREATQLGLEADWRNVSSASGIDAALFAGPVAHHHLGKAWLTASVMPQLAGLRHADSNASGKNLDEFQNWEARVLFGVDF